MRSYSRWFIPAANVFLLLTALQGAPRSAAQVSCTITYNCHGSSQCCFIDGIRAANSQLCIGSSACQCPSCVPSAMARMCQSCTLPAQLRLLGPPIAPSSLNPALTNAAQTIGTALGQRLAQALLGGGNNAPAPVNPAAAANDAAQQQTALAAHQLNESGIYLLKQRDNAGAINEFQKALALEPNDATIQYNLDLAKRAQKNAIVAGQTSRALGQLLGTDPASMGSSGDALNLVNLGSSTIVVDLHGEQEHLSTRNCCKARLTGCSGTMLRLPRHQTLPETRDIELLFQPPQSTPSQWPGRSVGQRTQIGE